LQLRLRAGRANSTVICLGSAQVRFGPDRNHLIWIKGPADQRNFKLGRKATSGKSSPEARRAGENPVRGTQQAV